MAVSHRTCSKTARFRTVILSLVLFSLLIAPGLPLARAEQEQGIETLRKLGKAFATIAKQASPAVVSVKVEKTTVRQYNTIPDWPFGQPFSPFEDDLFDFFRRDLPRRQPRQRKYRQTAQGSGFIISADGYILTNNHVVGGADKVTVKLLDGREFDANTIGTDPESDVALIRIDATDLHSLELADSDNIEVGEWVLAIGNPFGLGHTVTAGIVSGKGRSNVGLTTYEDFIQTDAAINPGNSGGPLINLDGKVVGINAAIIGPGGNIGIGFAIPVNMAKAIYPQLKEGGTVVRGFLGVAIQSLTPDFAKAFGLEEDVKGVLVPEVHKDSSADKAGIKPGDIIVEFDGQPVETAKQLQNKVAMLKPGTKVEMTALRNGKRMTFTVELGERPSAGGVAGEKPRALEKLGLAVGNLTDDLARRFGYQDLSGVIVTAVEPGSIAASAGITQGSLITELNRKKITNTKEFNQAVTEAAEKGSLLMLVKQGKNALYVMITIPKE